MKQKEDSKKLLVKKRADSLGINLKIGKKPSGKIHSPGKLEEANRILSNMKSVHTK